MTRLDVFPKALASTLLRALLRLFKRVGVRQPDTHSTFACSAPGFFGDVWWGYFFFSCSARRELLLNIPRFSFWYTPRIACDSECALDSNGVCFFRKKGKEKEGEREGDGGMQGRSLQLSRSCGSILKLNPLGVSRSTARVDRDSKLRQASRLSPPLAHSLIPVQGGEW